MKSFQFTQEPASNWNNGLILMLVTDTHGSLPLQGPLTYVHPEFQVVAEAKLQARSFLLITPPLGYREELGCLWLLRAVP